jgi:hypothetical protein
MPFLEAKKLDFYNLIPFNSDTVVVGHDYKVLAEMYFRIGVDEIIHSRHVFEFMDFLGSVGGVTEVLTRTSCFMIGGFLAWNSAIETMLSLYSCELSCSGAEKDGHHDHARGHQDQGEG